MIKEYKKPVLLLLQLDTDLIATSGHVGEVTGEDFNGWVDGNPFPTDEGK